MRTKEPEKKQYAPVMIPEELHRLLKAKAARGGKKIREILEPVIAAFVADERQKTEGA